MRTARPAAAAEPTRGARAARPRPARQVLGRVWPQTQKRHGAKLVSQFKEAAAQRPSDAALWELLGDLLAGLEPAGGCRAPLGWTGLWSALRCGRRPATSAAAVLRRASTLAGGAQARLLLPG